MTLAERRTSITQRLVQAQQQMGHWGREVVALEAQLVLIDELESDTAKSGNGADPTAS